MSFPPLVSRITCLALVCAARALHALPTPAQDTSKGAALADIEVMSKLPLLGKVKDCCGYPIGLKSGFRLTFYWLAYESEYANETYDTDIYDRYGFWLGRYPAAFVYELRLEGSGVLMDGRVLNYDGACAYGIGTCFATLDLDQHPLGRGVQGRRLEPFRSVAVDPRYIPIGSPLYVPEIVGLLLPDGTRHDGCVRADDMGGAIKQHKLDFFVESYFNFKYLADQLWWHLKATPHLDEPRCEYLRLHEPREIANDRTDWARLHAKSRHQAMRLKAHPTRRPTVASKSRPQAPAHLAESKRRPGSSALRQRAAVAKRNLHDRGGREQP